MTHSPPKVGSHLHRSMQLNIPLEHLFFVGDIQGGYDNFMAALTAAGFSADAGHRVFAVGDLIDGNPDGDKCLNLLNEPWFNSTRGNHEIYMHKACRKVTAESLAVTSRELKELAVVTTGNTFDHILKNIDLREAIPDAAISAEMQLWLSAGGSWFFLNQFTPERQLEIIKQLNGYLFDGTLPVTLSIECQGETFGLAHSWIPGIKWKSLTRSHTSLKLIGERKLKNRQLFRGLEFLPPEHPYYVHHGLSALILGHCVCPDKKPITRGNTLFLDTGAKRGGYPTVWTARQVLSAIKR